MRYLLLATLLLTSLNLTAFDEDDEKNFDEIDYKLLTLSPEKYEHKKVTYQGVYLGATVTFLPYMEKSGIEASKYYGLGVGNMKLPVIAKKSRNRDLDEQLVSIKNGSIVQIFGKVKEFREEPEMTTLPHFYLEFYGIKVISEGNGKVKGDDNERQGKRRFFNR